MKKFYKKESFLPIHYHFLYENNKHSHKGINSNIRFLYPKNIFGMNGFIYNRNIKNSPLWQDIYGIGWDSYFVKQGKMSEDRVKRALENTSKEI